MPELPSITIVGPGRLGSALAAALHEAGIRVDEVAGRTPASARRVARLCGARAASVESAELLSRVTWLCVRDNAIASTARELAARGDWKDRVVFHSSGALASDELASLRERGAAVASVHPMMSFVEGVKPDLHGVTFALEGDARAVAAARRIVRALGAEAITIRKSAKTLYHCWGAFGSPLVVALLATADEVARASGLSPAQARKTLAPMLRQTIENYVRKGAAAAFSGPLVRGDVETVRRHLDSLRKVPAARETYVALVRTALEFLPVERKREVEKLVSSFKLKVKSPTLRQR